jgi:hypothetical protein
MRFSNLWAFLLFVCGGLVTAWCCAAPAPKDKSATPVIRGLVVHEWGTFSTFSGSNGTNLRFYPYDNDLPDFVHGYLPKNSKARPEGGTISLETPVLYFYSDKALTASVRVDFPKGILTEWYPQAGRTAKRLDWPTIKVKPGEKGELLRESKKSRYYAARETDAAALLVPFTENGAAKTEEEKFLFYRGVGTFGIPLSARALGDDKFTVRWSGEAPVDDLILLRVQGGKIRFQSFRFSEKDQRVPQTNVQLPSRDATVKALGETLEKILTAKGLFGKEARAMVKTWSNAWFEEEGTRILYVLPNKLTEELLPLRLDPKPDSLVRVLIGRHDILTPEREKHIDSLVTKIVHVRSTPGQETGSRAAMQELAKLGRYRDAAWQAAESRLKIRR